MSGRTPNHSMQRIGVSRSAHHHFVCPGRLAPTADASRSAVTVMGTQRCAGELAVLAGLLA